MGGEAGGTARDRSEPANHLGRQARAPGRQATPSAGTEPEVPGRGTKPEVPGRSPGALPSRLRGCCDPTTLAQGRPLRTRRGVSLGGQKGAGRRRVVSWVAEEPGLPLE